MLNFRKLRQDFSPSVVKEGRDLHDGKRIVSAKIIRLDSDTIRFSGKVLGKYDNPYESEIEIDRFDSETIHSNCDCSYQYDCQHLAAILFYLEEHINAILVDYSNEADIEKDDSINIEEKKELLETIKEAKNKDVVKKDAAYQKQVLQEYVSSSCMLSNSVFFLPSEENVLSRAEIGVIFNQQSLYSNKKNKSVEFQLAMRLPFRSKPLQVPYLKQFLDAVHYEEQMIIAGKRYYFSLNSFDAIGKQILTVLIDRARLNELKANDRSQRIGQIDFETFGMLLAKIYDLAMHKNSQRPFEVNDGKPIMPSLFFNNLETPILCSFVQANLQFDLEYLDPPAAKILITPNIFADDNVISMNDVALFTCSHPGLIFKDVYYRFPKHIKRMHLMGLHQIRDMTIPQPLFGTFVENSLPELKRYAEVKNEDVIEQFITLPYAKKLHARCVLSYLNGELEASLFFLYDEVEVHASPTNLAFSDIDAFITEEGILARDLVEERELLECLFQDFLFNEENGSFITKSDKKIVEFMTEVIPRHQDFISFECPQNLLDQFIYDKTTFTLHLDCSEKVGYYKADLKVDGELKDVKIDLLWDCMASKRAFIELKHTKKRTPKGKSASIFSKILVLDLSVLSLVVQLFDELGIQTLNNHCEDRPLWSLVNIDEGIFENLPIQFSMSDSLKEIRRQMLGEKEFTPSALPTGMLVDLREYQKEGVHWLERLRKMYLNGILADDMGLGKSAQTIVAITQRNNEKSQSSTPSIIVCPTSLLYNWKEELAKFNPKLKALIVDGIPNFRKKLISQVSEYDIIITSYTLMQKDIEEYQKTHFAYAILDEGQHIKNRSTRNAKSVKQIPSSHKLILTGTPIENSLDELWSLFDFLMPGFLSSYDRFVEKYVRGCGDVYVKNIEYLKRKVSPFILRRMKEDVLKDLPPVSELTYHCQFTDRQLELYKSYAQSAKDELVKLVAKEGFDRVQIHVLATLTRLKQICCHPAIFAKEKAEEGDSAKYEMLLELLQTLIEGKHKTVIFSQYTRMLQIMKNDLQQKNINFSYLDGSTKNRLEIVKEFNANDDIPVFLVSLKAGGTGLNITGADTVIHYDMWWNPAVENQATDRVHRLGQKKSVSAYKLVTKNSIEEKIVAMQKRKKGLVKKVVSCDDEAISKLTWDEVLELLQT